MVETTFSLDAAMIEKMAAKVWNWVYYLHLHYFKRYPSRQDQEDISQEVLVRFVKYFASIRGEHEGSYYAFAKKIVITVLIKRLTERPPPTISLDQEFETDEGGKVTLENSIAADEEEKPDVILLKEKKKRIFLQALSKIADKDREILELSLEGFSHKEIGELLDISEVDSRVRSYRARGELKKVLQSSLSRLDLTVEEYLNV